jgi:hypothetical protein
MSDPSEKRKRTRDAPATRAAPAAAAADEPIEAVSATPSQSASQPTVKRAGRAKARAAVAAPKVDQATNVLLRKYGRLASGSSGSFLLGAADDDGVAPPPLGTSLYFVQDLAAALAAPSGAWLARLLDAVRDAELGSTDELHGSCVLAVDGVQRRCVGCCVVCELETARRICDDPTTPDVRAAHPNGSDSDDGGASVDMVAATTPAAGDRLGAEWLRARMDGGVDASPSSEQLADWAASANHVGAVRGVGALCGVQLVWVADSHRRGGVATAMLDAARRDVVYGYVVPREHCAFSQPTREGKMFARRYTRRGDFFIFMT